jgi:monovalent cation:H+ antiporter, CPA1 family
MRLDVGTVFVLLFVVATIVAVVARRLRVPYTVALVLAGLVLGALDLVTPPRLTQQLLFSVVLPGLVFEAAFNLRAIDLWHNRRTLFLLSVPGVLLATALTAILLPMALRTLETGVSLTAIEAVIFAALISATDPVAVVALFRRLGAPRRLTIVVEAESLLNDATAIALYLAALALVASTAARGPGTVNLASVEAVAATIKFIVVLVGGALIGGVVGAGVSFGIARINDPMVEITLTVVAAYGSFALAQQLGASGVLATVVAGILCGSDVARRGMSPTARVTVGAFWEYAAFALNSIVFLLIGFEVRSGALLAAWQVVLAAFLAVVVARAVIILLTAAAVRPTAERLPKRWTVIMTWGGLRGALSMVLALSLPLVLPHRSLLVTMTFGVVTLSILGQGLTMPALLRHLSVTGGDDVARRQAFEAAREDFRAARAALEELDYLSAAGLVPEKVDVVLRRRYLPRLQQAESRLKTSGAVLDASEASVEAGVAPMPGDGGSVTLDTGATVRRLERYLLDVERARLSDALRAGSMPVETYDQLAAELDARRAALDGM